MATSASTGRVGRLAAVVVVVVVVVVVASRVPGEEVEVLQHVSQALPVLVIAQPGSDLPRGPSDGDHSESYALHDEGGVSPGEGTAAVAVEVGVVSQLQ